MRYSNDFDDIFEGLDGLYEDGGSFKQRMAKKLLKLSESSSNKYILFGINPDKESDTLPIFMSSNRSELNSYANKFNSAADQDLGVVMRVYSEQDDFVVKHKKRYPSNWRKGSDLKNLEDPDDVAELEQMGGAEGLIDFFIAELRKDIDKSKSSVKESYNARRSRSRYCR